MGGGGTFPTPYKIAFASLATFARAGSANNPRKDAEAVGHPQNPTWSLSHPKIQILRRNPIYRGKNLELGKTKAVNR